MKSLLLLFLSLPFVVHAQDIPSLNENDFITKADAGTKSGWMKIYLDAHFKETVGEANAKYLYYEFVNINGKYESTRSKKPAFPNDAARIVFTSPGKLLNGTIDFYGTNGHRRFRYIFKNGFLLNEFDFRTKGGHAGQLVTSFEYLPAATSVEMRCNAYDHSGRANQYAHDVNNGQSFLPIPEMPYVSLQPLNVAEVWQPIEEDAFRYDMFTDTIAHSGKSSACIRSIDKTIHGSGGLAQFISAEPYRGKRIRISGWMKTENANWAGLWTRIDGAMTPHDNVQAEALFFDNMKSRRVTGITNWTKYEIVADVPAEAVTITFGAMLHGTGQLWFDDMAVEIVDVSVPVTGETLQPANPILRQPAKLDFEE